MSKHKPVLKWVAVLDEGIGEKPAQVRTAEVEVIETPKQFRLVRGPTSTMVPPESRRYRLARRACGYRTTINKGRRDCPLHDTEKAALVALHRHYERQLNNARAGVRAVAQQHHVVATYLEQNYEGSD